MLEKAGTGGVPSSIERLGLLGCGPVVVVTAGVLQVMVDAGLLWSFVR